MALVLYSVCESNVAQGIYPTLDKKMHRKSRTKNAAHWYGWLKFVPDVFVGPAFSRVTPRFNSIAFVQSPPQLVPNGIEEVLAFELHQPHFKRGFGEFDHSAAGNNKRATVQG